MNISDILQGKFLVKNDAIQNWRLVAFIAILLFVSIFSSRLADAKLYEIRKLKEQTKNYSSEYSQVQKEIMRLQIESYVAKKVENVGLKPIAIPPIKIIVKDDKK